METDPLVKEFLIESYENLEQLDRDLVELEKDPNNRDKIASIFRTIHTIKGTCGFFGFTKLQALTHVGENLLSKLRDGVLTANGEITGALLAMIDGVREMLASIENTNSEGERDDSALIAKLAELQNEPAKIEEKPKPTVQKRPLGDILIEAGLAEASDIKEALAAQASGDKRPLGQILVDNKVVAQHEVAGALKMQQETAVSESNIRVDVGLLDKLMNLVGELVLTRNQILQFMAAQRDSVLHGTAQRLNLITTELQEGVMKTRMQPIGKIWSRLPRVVRDLATSCGKQVRLEMEGNETGLDKTIIEAIKDPLTHIVRNSVDHGVETAEVRIAKGKNPEGRLSLRAYHESGQVNIEIVDDGGGIDPQRVKLKAVEKGLITPAQAGSMSERDAVNLIFLPGFSTAEQITNVSGRGVGMDVVKTNVEKIGGSIEIRSRPNEGTAIRIRIPLTLAIIPALMVVAGGDRYAIPQVSLLELVRLEGEQAKRDIESVGGAPVCRLRGKLLPLVDLSHELKVDRLTANDEVVNIVVLQADERQFGLVVERILDTEEIVVKPLCKQLKGIQQFAGATIMGDGRVALILDVPGIARSAQVVSATRDRGKADSSSNARGRDEEQESLLLVGLGADRRLAIPLSLVARLEEIPRKAVEHAESTDVVQYRGGIMPLVDLADVLGTSAERDPETMRVVVHSEEGRCVGLVVDRILDIVRSGFEVTLSARRHGVVGSAVIQNRVTDLLDVPGIIRAAVPDFFPPA